MATCDCKSMQQLLLQQGAPRVGTGSPPKALIVSFYFFSCLTCHFFKELLAWELGLPNAVVQIAEWCMYRY